MGGAMHPGSCSLKATLGRGGDRERPSSFPSLALKPGELRIISVSIFCPTQRLRASECIIFTKVTDCSSLTERRGKLGWGFLMSRVSYQPAQFGTQPLLQSVSTPVPHSTHCRNVQ